MKFLKEILNVWKRNLVPAIIGLAPLVAVVILLPVWNPSLNVRTNLLIPGLGVAAWVFGVFFSREAPERSTAKCLAALLPPVILAIGLGIWCTHVPNDYRLLCTLEGYGEFLRLYHLVYIGCLLAITLYFYLSGLAGRAIGKTTGRSLLAGFLVWLFTAPALSGLSAAIALALPVPETLLYIRPGLAYCCGFLPAIPLLAGWVVILRRRGERNTPLRALRDFAVGTAGSFLLFGGACGVTLLRANGALELAKQTGRTFEFQHPYDPAGAEALQTLLRNSEAWYQHCDKHEPRIELPLESIHSWTAPDSPVTPEMRSMTAAELDSPEAKAYFAAAAALKPHNSFFPEKYDLPGFLPMLNTLRSAARQLGGTAAVYHWQGKRDRILPFLRLEQEVGRTLDSAPKLALSGLVRIALDSMLAKNIVQLGPDGPQYAEEYRRCLDYFRNADYTVSDEMEFLANYLQKALRWPKELDYPFHNRPLPFFQRIFVISLISDQVRDRVAAQPLIAELRAAAKIGGTEQSGHLPEHALFCLKREKVARTLFPTLLALKLYRSLTGNYPERLEALVPELLPALPLDPETGEAFPYTRTPDGFTLSYRNGKHTITTGSKPDY